VWFPPFMSPHRLPNYLKTHRMRAGFTHKELAFLLGASGAESLSRYEHGVRLPALETALAYEAVFGVPVRELFPGVFDEIEREVINRAKVLLAAFQDAPSNPLTCRKCELLRAIVHGPDIVAENS
jgi:transcriptional regulator with XRE-family HTH domain